MESTSTAVGYSDCSCPYATKAWVCEYDGSTYTGYTVEAPASRRLGMLIVTMPVW